MKPGIYKDLPFDQYLAIDALSNTAMGALAQSPRHYKLAPPLERQKALVLGNMIHTGRLEPDKFADRYAVCPDYHLDELNLTTKGERTESKVTKYVKERVAEFERATEQEGRESVPAEWYRDMLNVVESLYADADANKLFNAKGSFEITLVWEDPETGMLCKGRIDKLCTVQGKLVDLKSCEDLLKFPKSFANYSYARQIAHYQAGYIVLTGEVLEPWIVAIEKKPPYCCQSAPVDEAAIEWGNAERRRLINLLDECRKSDNWPGPETPEAWRLPEWMLNESVFNRRFDTEKEIVVV